jgi:hypothetical protein
MFLPPEAGESLQSQSTTFARPTFPSFDILLGAAILSVGRPTIANLLRTAAPLDTGHLNTFQRVFPSSSRSAMRLACGNCRLVLTLVPADRPVPLVGDDTAESHPGRKVDGKARNRDSARSGHGDTAWRHGHRWVILALLVRFPRATGPGPCRCAWTWTAPRKTTGSAADRTARRGRSWPRCSSPPRWPARSRSPAVRPGGDRRDHGAEPGHSSMPADESRSSM